MPFGSPVVPDVNRICSGVSCESSATGPASSFGSSATPVLERQRRPLSLQRDYKLGIADNQRRPHITRHPRSKLRRPIRIQRNRDHSTQHASIKRGDPLRAILRPQHHPIARHQRFAPPAAPQNAPPIAQSLRSSLPCAERRHTERSPSRRRSVENRQAG